MIVLEKIDEIQLEKMKKVTVSFAMYLKRLDRIFGLII